MLMLILMTNAIFFANAYSNTAKYMSVHKIKAMLAAVLMQNTAQEAESMPQVQQNRCGCAVSYLQKTRCLPVKA